MRWHETPEFNTLREEWYAKAKASGFEDIEQTVDREGTPGRLLLGPSPGDLGRRFLAVQDSKVYYRLARAHLWTIRWGMERAVWALHSEGMSTTKISGALSKRYGCSRKVVRRVVEKQRKVMLERADEEISREQ